MYLREGLPVPPGDHLLRQLARQHGQHAQLQLRDHAGQQQVLLIRHLGHDRLVESLQDLIRQHLEWLLVSLGSDSTSGHSGMVAEGLASY